MGGVAVVFSEMARPIPKVTIWREAVAFMKEIKVPAICVTDGSDAFLERLGWIRDGEEYRWPV